MDSPFDVPALHTITSHISQEAYEPIIQGCGKNEPEAVSVGAGVAAVWWWGRLRRPHAYHRAVRRRAAQAPHPRVHHNPRPY